MTDGFPDGIDVERSRYAAKSAWERWLPRGILTMFVGFVLLALFNVFGQTTTTTTASAPAARLVVAAPATLRGGLLYQVVVTVVAKRRLGAAHVVLSSGWFSGLTTNAEVPQPTPQDNVNGRTVFSLGTIRAGEYKNVRIYFQVNPTTIAWNRPQTVELDDGAARIAVVRRKVTVYP